MDECEHEVNLLHGLLTQKRDMDNSQISASITNNAELLVVQEDIPNMIDGVFEPQGYQSIWKWVESQHREPDSVNIKP